MYKLFSILLTFIYLNSIAQNTNYVVPIVVHQFSDTSDFFDANEIQTILNEVNINYNSSGISFVNANNYLNISDPNFFNYMNNGFQNIEASFVQDQQKFKLFSYSRVNPKEFMNIVIVDELTKPGQNDIEAFGTFGELSGSPIDGIFIEKNSFDAFTVGHEIGHCLGLWHIFDNKDLSDNEGPQFIANDLCNKIDGYKTGDFIPDTPHMNANGELVFFKGCASFSSIEFGCNNNDVSFNQSQNCDSSLPTLENNIMGYSSCKDCLYEITNGQIQRMQFFMAHFRNSFVTSPLNSTAILNPYGGESKLVNQKQISFNGENLWVVGAQVPKETYWAGDKSHIIWHDHLGSRNIDLELSLNNGVSYITFESNIPSNYGLNKKLWNVPFYNTSNECKIRIRETNGNVLHESGLFSINNNSVCVSIENLPNYSIFDNVAVNYNTCYPTESHSIQLSTDNGLSYNYTLASSVIPNNTTNTFNFTIDDISYISQNAKIKVSRNSNPNDKSESNPFEISCPIAVYNQTPSLSANSSELCSSNGSSNNPLIFLNNAILPTSDYHFNWYLNGTHIASTQSDNINIEANNYGAGTYTVLMTDGENCNGPLSNGVTIYETDCLTGSCSIPSNLNVSVNVSQAVLIWDKTPDTYSYHVRYKESSASNWTELTYFIGGGNHCSGTNCNFTLTGLTGDTNYDYQVRSVCNGGNTTNWSNSFNFSTEQPNFNFCTGPTYYETIGTFDDGSGQDWLPYGGLNNNGQAYQCPYHIQPVCPSGLAPTQINISFSLFNFLAYNPSIGQGQRVTIVNGTDWIHYTVQGSVGENYPGLNTPIPFSASSLIVYLDNPFPNAYINGFTLSYEAICPCNLPPPLTISSDKNTVCSDMYDEVTITASSNVNTDYSYQWLKDGNEITNANNEIFLATSSGNYSVYLVDNSNNCVTAISNAITINDTNCFNPCENLSISSNYGYETCESHNGFIELSVSGGTAPYNFEWNDQHETEDRINLTEGTYQVTIIDANMCTLNESFEITNSGLKPLAYFQISVNDLMITVTDGSINSLSVDYDFGDGTISSNPNVTHQFSNYGIYTICQTSTNNCNSDEFCLSINLEENCPTNLLLSNTYTQGINAFEEAGAINADCIIENNANVSFDANNGVTLQPNFEVQTNAEFQVYDDGCNTPNQP